LTKIELALEILHTCSSLVQDNSKKSKQYLEEEKLEEEIKSRSLEQKPEKLVAPVKLMPSQRFNRQSSDTLMPYHRLNIAVHMESSQKS